MSEYVDLEAFAFFGAGGGVTGPGNGLEPDFDLEPGTVGSDEK